MTEASTAVLPEVEAFIRREVAKQVAMIRQSGMSAEVLSDEWDFRIDPASQYPGHGWTLHGSLPIGPGLVGFIWRMRRTEVARLGLEPVMKPVKA